jgi:hypothetical protein
MPDKIGTSKHHDPAVFRNLLDKREEVFDENDIRDVALFIAHVQEGKSVRTLARQVGWDMNEIRSSIEYVRDQIKAVIDPDDRIQE